MSKAKAWMPLYIADYLGDTQRLTTEQHGAYLLLMMDYWRNGPPPDNDEILQQITLLGRAKWQKHKAILRAFFTVESNAWHHKRIEHERASAMDNSERRASKAKAAADARWSAKSNAPSMPEALPVVCPSPSPSPSPSYLAPKGACASDDAPPPPPSEEGDQDDGLKPQHVVEEWNKLAPKLGKPKVRDLTPTRRELLKARIGQYALDDFLTVLAAVEQSAFLRGDTGWQGCTFDWIFKRANFQKILEGNYDG